MGSSLTSTAQSRALSSVMSREVLCALMEAVRQVRSPQLICPSKFRLSPSSESALQQPPISANMATEAPPLSASHVTRVIKIIANTTKLAAIACACLLGVSAFAAGIQQAFLVQNSGWMEPFYTDPTSQFKQLVAAVASATTNSDDTVFTLAFSQSKASNVSPSLIASGIGGADMVRQLAERAVAMAAQSEPALMMPAVLPNKAFVDPTALNFLQHLAQAQG